MHEGSRPAGGAGGWASAGAKDRLILLAILLMALGLRIGFVFYLNPERIYFYDTIPYIEAAKSLLNGDGFGPSYSRAPLYPVFLAGIMGLFPGKLVAIKLVEALLACVTVLLVYVIGKEIWGSATGKIGALFVAVHPYLFVLSAFLYAEILFTLLLVGCVWTLLRTRDAARGFLGGVLGGTAALAKAAGLVLLPVGAVWLVVFAAGSRRLRLASAGCFLLGASLVIAPWTVRNATRFGEVSPVDARAERHLPSTLETEPDAYLARFATQFVRFWSPRPDRLRTADEELREKAAARDTRMQVNRHPAEGIGRYDLPLTLVLFPYYVLALVGAWLARDRFRKASLLLLVTLGFAVGYSLLVVRVRFRLPVEPFIALFAAVGVRGVLQGAARILSRTQ